MKIHEVLGREVPVNQNKVLRRLQGLVGASRDHIFRQITGHSIDRFQSYDLDDEEGFIKREDFSALNQNRVAEFAIWERLNQNHIQKQYRNAVNLTASFGLISSQESSDLLSENDLKKQEIFIREFDVKEIMFYYESLKKDGFLADVREVVDSSNL